MPLNLHEQLVFACAPVMIYTMFYDRKEGYVIGDRLIVRATEELAAGEEVRLHMCRIKGCVYFVEHSGFVEQRGFVGACLPDALLGK
eukprot:scaffold15468_cov22-Tisochrysis_lutea.AAC.3